MKPKFTLSIISVAAIVIPHACADIIVEPFPVPAIPIAMEDGDQLTVQEFEASNAAKMQDLHTELDQFQTANYAAALQKIQQLDMPEVIVDSVTGKISVLAGLDGNVPYYFTSDNRGAADTISIDEVLPGGSSGLNLDGTGGVLGMWEISDPYTPHAEFTTTGGSPRVFDIDGASVRQNLHERIHASHVAGTMVGRGVSPNSNAKGMAPNAVLHAYDVEDDLTEMSGVFTDADASNDFHVSNHSYGRNVGWAGTIDDINGNPHSFWVGDAQVSAVESELFGRYNNESKNLDEIVWLQKTYLPVLSAGNTRFETDPLPASSDWVFLDNNAQLYLVQRSHTAAPGPDGGTDGYDTLEGRKVSKNAFVVASAAKILGGYGGPASVTYSNFSSAGPTDDGGMGVCITAAGEGLISAGEAAGTYYSSTGTSMAAPGIAGTVQVLTQYFQNLYGSTRRPWASTLGGLLQHTADEVGAPGPDFRGGAGLANALSAAHLLTADAADGNYPHFKEVWLNSAENVVFIVRALGGGTPLKVTARWLTPAATPGPVALDDATSKLSNDLDLRVKTSGAGTFEPWVIDPANPSAAAITGDNDSDTWEQVLVANPVAGQQYIISLSAKDGTELVDENGDPTTIGASLFISGNIVEEQPEFCVTITKHASEADTYVLSWPSVVGALYRVETSPSLEGGSWTQVTGDIAPRTTISTYSAVTSDKRRFWRVKRTQ